MIKLITGIILITLTFGCADASVLEPGVNVVPVLSSDGDGTGFAISEHTWVTAAHVVDTDKRVILVTNSGNIVATVTEISFSQDIAVLRANNLLVENYLDTCKPTWGEHVAGCGYNDSKIGDTYILQCETGTIGGLNTSSENWPGQDLIFAFNKSTRGFSGGPLVNPDGCAVGMIVGGPKDDIYSRSVKINHL